MKKCSRCTKIKELKEFRKDKHSEDGHGVYCKICQRKFEKDRYWSNLARERARTRQKALAHPELHKEWILRNPIKKFLYDAKRRALKKGLPFEVDISDVPIPKLCPVFGVPLTYTEGDKSYSPSIDCVVPALGYVKGNVAVISNRANRIKNDGTIEELEAIVKWLKSRAESKTEFQCLNELDTRDIQL
jgi:hypothetical protein